MTAEAYSLELTRRYVEELYPVLLDAHGNVIDGFNRLDHVPGWRTETRSSITTPAQLWAARIIANTCRRVVSRSERAEQLSEFARCLVEEGLPKDQVVARISEITTFTERYVRMLLPAEYKRTYKSELGSELEPGQGERELSSELEASRGKSDLRSQLAADGQVTVPEASRPRCRQLAPAGSIADAGTPGPQAGGGLLPQLPPGAPDSQEQVTVPTEHRPGAEPVAREAAQPGTPGPTQPSHADAGAGAPGHPGPEETREAALDYIRRYHDRHAKPDAEYLSWEVAINVGVSEREALELIGLVQGERGLVGQGRSPVAGPIRGSVTCPLCSREGAERGRILGRAQDPQTGHLTLWEFVMEAMG